MTEHVTRAVSRAAAAALVAGLMTAAPPAVSVADRHEWGEIKAPNQVLRQGCRYYEYRYSIRPPEGLWALETFLIRRNGRKIASDVFQEGQDPETRQARFRVCRPGTRPGRFVIRGKLSVQDDHDPAVETVGWIRPEFFRLRRP